MSMLLTIAAVASGLGAPVSKIGVTQLREPQIIEAIAGKRVRFGGSRQAQSFGLNHKWSMPIDNGVVYGRWYTEGASLCYLMENRKSGPWCNLIYRTNQNFLVAVKLPPDDPKTYGQMLGVGQPEVLTIIP